MGVWEQIKRAKKAGQKVLEKYDGVEAEARASDPDRIARSLATGSTETRLGDPELTPDEFGGLVSSGEIVIEHDEGAGAMGVSSENPSQYSFSRESEESPEISIESDPIEEWDVADRLFGQGFSHEEETDNGLELTEEGVPSLEEGATDALGLLTDPEVGQAVTSLGGDAVDLTDPTCELIATDSGLTTDTAIVGLSSKEVETFLLQGPYAEIEGLTVEHMEELSRFDAKLLTEGEHLGRAVLKLLEAYRSQDGSLSESWESALWVTGVHWDVDVRDNLGDIDTADSDEEQQISLRCLAWSVLEDIEELHGAAGGSKESCGLMLRYNAVVDTLAHRSQYLMATGLSVHEQLDDDLPIERLGILAVEGFAWDQRETN